jgi:hypothetical protein
MQMQEQEKPWASSYWRDRKTCVRPFSKTCICRRNRILDVIISQSICGKICLLFPCTTSWRQVPVVATEFHSISASTLDGLQWSGSCCSDANVNSHITKCMECLKISVYFGGKEGGVLDIDRCITTKYFKNQEWSCGLDSF